MNAPMVLSPEALAKIDRAAAKYPPERRASAIMAALTIAQDERGWLSRETVEFVAGYLNMPPVAAWEVATFYSMYNLEPPGRYKLSICTNLPCALSGADRAAAHLRKRLGVEFGETTPDGRFTLREAECMGACGDAPVCLLNEKKMLSFMTPEQLDRLIEDLK